MARSKQNTGQQELQFSGYSEPSIPTPNQLLDVVPHFGQRIMRLAAFIHYSNGGRLCSNNPPALPYTRIEKGAGISKPLIKKTIDEALEKNVIREVSPGCASGPGRAGHSYIYELNPDNSGDYIDDPVDFCGFYTGKGYYTMMPKEWYTFTIPQCKWETARIVTAVFRQTQGFIEPDGGRRTKAALSLQKLGELTNMERKQVRRGIMDALETEHIKVASSGTYGGIDPEANTYSVNHQLNSATSSDRLTSATGNSSAGSIVPPGQLNPATTGGKYAPPAKRLIPATSMNSEGVENKFGKQQTNTPGPAELAVVDVLLTFGISRPKAEELVKNYDLEIIRKQCEWLPLRKPSKPAAMLISSIQGNYCAPEAPGVDDLEKKERRRQEEHEAEVKREMRPEYIAYLETLEEQYSKDFSEVYDEFLANEYRLQQNPMYQKQPSFRNAHDRGRPTRFMEFFNEKGISIPDFDEWIRNIKNIRSAA